MTDNDDGANAEDNGLPLKADHRGSLNFSILTNYTYSHCLSEGDFDTELSGPDHDNPDNRNSTRGSCVNDFRQIFHLSYLVSSPYFSGSITHKLLGNREHAGIVVEQSGGWLTPTVGQDISLTGVGLEQPNLVGSSQPSNPTLAEWFNTSAYAKQAAGTFGNAAASSIVGPSAFSYDALLSRIFRIREGQNLLVRFEAFNALNHPTFANPGATLPELY